MSYQVESINKFYSYEKIILIFVILAGMYIILPFLMTILLAMITAYVMDPIVKRMRRVLKSYDVSILATILLIALPFAIIIMYSINDLTPLVIEIKSFAKEINGVLQNMESYMILWNLEGFTESIRSLVSAVSEYTMAGIASFVFSIPKLLLDVVIYLIATYYFLKDGDRSLKGIYSYVDTLDYKEKRMIRSIFTGLRNSFDVLFISYIAISMIIAIFAWIGFSMMDIPYPAILALMCGIFSFLPMLGVWLIYGTVGVYKLAAGDPTGAIMVVTFGAIFLNIVPDFYIRPILGSRTGKVHPLTIILGFFGGPLMFGMNGFLIGPIVLVIVETVVTRYIDFYIRPEAALEDIKYHHEKSNTDTHNSENENEQ